MAAEVNEGCPSGKLYGQSLSLSLAAYLHSRFSTSGNKLKQSQKRFSRTQAERLEDYIRANIGADLSLYNLAHLVEISPRRFLDFFYDVWNYASPLHHDGAGDPMQKSA